MFKVDRTDRFRVKLIKNLYYTSEVRKTNLLRIKLPCHYRELGVGIDRCQRKQYVARTVHSRCQRQQYIFTLKTARLHALRVSKYLCVKSRTT